MTISIGTRKYNTAIKSAGINPHLTRTINHILDNVGQEAIDSMTGKQIGLSMQIAQRSWDQAKQLHGYEVVEGGAAIHQVSSGKIVDMQKFDS